MLDKTSDAQKRASKKYRDKQDPALKRYQSYRRTARGFIKNHATDEDLEDLTKLIEEIKKER